MTLYFWISCIISINFITILICLYKIVVIYNKDRTPLLSNFKKYGMLVYWTLQNKRKKKEKKKLEKMTESSRKFYEKTKKWKLQTETFYRSVKRKQREALRNEVLLPVDSGGLNLSTFSFFFKGILLLVCTISLGINNKVFDLYIYVVLVCIYLLFHFIINRATLRESRFWFWRPWPTVLHVYAKGHMNFELRYILILLFLKVQIWWILLIFIFHFIFLRFVQSRLGCALVNAWYSFWRGYAWIFMEDFFYVYTNYYEPVYVVIIRPFKFLWKEVKKRLPKIKISPYWTLF